MISISDNSAADLLINLLGRERVEQDQATYGHTDPGSTFRF
jgi:beta-lactamase class A